MTPLAWAALAAAALLVPGRREAEDPDPGAGAARRPPGQSGLLGSPRAAVGAAVAVAVAVIAVLGPVTGTFVAAGLGPLAGAGVRALQRRPAAQPPNRSLAVTLDLCAAALRAGRTPADALSAALSATQSSAEPATAAALGRVAGLLRLGADPVRAWAVLDADGPLGPLAATAARSAVSGIRSAVAFERLADDIRAECAGTANARAQRAGVLAIAPLAACFLPSFVCLGIVPVIVGVAQSALGVLR